MENLVDYRANLVGKRTRVRVIMRHPDSSKNPFPRVLLSNPNWNQAKKKQSL